MSWVRLKCFLKTAVTKTSSHLIFRVYTIYGDEVQIEILKISTTCQKYDLQKYQFERDGQTVFPSYPNFLLLPFVFEEDFYQPLPDYIQ
jgi:hypothetical protein